MVVHEGVLLATLGMVPAVWVAYAAARWMSALLFGVKPGDPITFAAAVALALLITVAGSLIPALRAVRVSPTDALRAE
jgi:putative ABC transport system permease protein